MLKSRTLNAILIFLLLSSSVITKAENWPNFRGPKGDGTSTETGVPVKWDANTNVLWKVAVPGTGYASPVVWGRPAIYHYRKN